MLCLVLNEWNWTSLLRCITNVTIYSFTLMFTSTAKSKTSTISLTFPKTLKNVVRKIAAMILHTTIENLVILNYKRLKKKGKKIQHWLFCLPYGHTTSPKHQPSSKCQHDKGIMGLFCRSTLLKHQVSFISRLKNELVSDIAAGKI